VVKEKEAGLYSRDESDAKSPAIAPAFAKPGRVKHTSAVCLCRGGCRAVSR